MERRKRDGNHSSPQNNLIHDLEGNEENRYPALDSNKTKINDTKDHKMSTEQSQRRNPESNH
jgi:hypothetical protein